MDYGWRKRLQNPLRILLAECQSLERVTLGQGPVSRLTTFKKTENNRSRRKWIKTRLFLFPVGRYSFSSYASFPPLVKQLAWLSLEREFLKCLWFSRFLESSHHAAIRRVCVAGRRKATFPYGETIIGLCTHTHLRGARQHGRFPHPFKRNTHLSSLLTAGQRLRRCQIAFGKTKTKRNEMWWNSRNEILQIVLSCGVYRARMRRSRANRIRTGEEVRIIIHIKRLRYTTQRSGRDTRSCWPISTQVNCSSSSFHNGEYGRDRKTEKRATRNVFLSTLPRIGAEIQTAMRNWPESGSCHHSSRSSTWPSSFSPVCCSVYCWIGRRNRPADLWESPIG